MRTGFVILSSDEAPLLEHSLPAALGEGFDEALLIDNGCSDATQALAQRLGVPRLALPRRVPYTEAMNAGLRAISADAVALLQADTFVAPGYLAAGLKALGTDDVGSVAPKLLRASGPDPQDRLELIDAAAMSFDRRRKNSLVGHGAPAGRYSVAAEAFGADGAAALWRTEALRDCAIDGQYFDENLPGWGCDADLSWRAQLFGWRSRYEPGAVVHHVRTYSPSTRAEVSPADRRTQFRNRLLMIAKNETPADLVRDAGPLLLYEAQALGYALIREHELLPGYREAARRLPAALRARRQIQGRGRARRQIQARRRARRVPFGLEPPSG